MARLFVKGCVTYEDYIRDGAEVFFRLTQQLEREHGPGILWQQHIGRSLNWTYEFDSDTVPNREPMRIFHHPV